MGMHVCMGAMLQCSFGAAPSSLMVLPVNGIVTSNMPAANIMDHKPLVNILPFGTCSSMANPVVAAATAAKFGVMTPMPCSSCVVVRACRVGCETGCRGRGSSIAPPARDQPTGSTSGCVPFTPAGPRFFSKIAVQMSPPSVNSVFT